MDAPTRLFLIRHAEVEERYQRVFGGRIDMDLSPLGHEQAGKLAAYLRRTPFDAIYASPMKRVQQTVEKLFAAQHARPRFLEELREVDFGSWTGLTWEDVKVRFGISAFQWLDQLDRGLMAGAESAGGFRERIEQALREILRAAPGRSIGVVCHGGVIRMMLAILLDIPLVKMSGFDIDYASLTVVDCFPHKTEVQILNFAPWRDIP
ncbi:MAG: histidine phosphatase family protein [Verrucomicrobia bacterium]|nr:histidine phosphatase family protein [Verrucomicrobiota bacterium]